MLQVKLGLSATAAALTAHSLYVYQERKNIPTGRLLQFSPGSQGKNIYIYLIFLSNTDKTLLSFLRPKIARLPPILIYT